MTTSVVRRLKNKLFTATSGVVCPAEDDFNLGPAHEVHLRSERAAVGLELKFKGAVVQQCVQLVTVDALAEHVKDAVHRLLGVNMRTDAKVVRGPLIGEG